MPFVLCIFDDTFTGADTVANCCGSFVGNDFYLLFAHYG
jgi:hypothetical protein